MLRIQPSHSRSRIGELLLKTLCVRCRVGFGSRFRFHVFPELCRIFSRSNEIRTQFFDFMFSRHVVAHRYARGDNHSQQRSGDSQVARASGNCPPQIFHPNGCAFPQTLGAACRLGGDPQPFLGCALEHGLADSFAGSHARTRGKATGERQVMVCEFHELEICSLTTRTLAQVRCQVRCFASRQLAECGEASQFLEVLMLRHQLSPASAGRFGARAVPASIGEACRDHDNICAARFRGSRLFFPPPPSC